MPQLLELLSPAKNLECGISAIDHGADAVYIGALRFGARSAAGNSIEDIATLCNYAHQYGAKVYVTVNTIVYDNELDETIALIQQLQSIGVDALLIQDMGILSLLNKKTLNDSIALHASTQTDNRTADKVRWLASLGFKRVVLARELSINEIRAIHEAVPEVELEVFVHGALCVSYSGQCYASHYCFNRSANRGECAQFCRMAFDLKDANDTMIEAGKHLLSLRDMAQIDNIAKLADAGAVSFKIEGRLKDVDYVKNITAAYSEKLNELCRNHPEKYQRASMGKCTYTFTPDISKSFNRAFTTYFANGRKQGMANIHSPKSIGEPIAKVKEIRGNSFNVATTKSFSNGDGLCYYNDKMELIGFRVNRAEGNRLFPLRMPEDLKAGTMLYRNHDQAFDSLLHKPSAERKIAIELLLHVSADKLSLTMTDEQGNVKTTELQYEYQAAKTPQEDNIRRQLSKLGGTIYSCKSIVIKNEVDNPFIPSSILSKLRQNLTQSDNNFGTTQKSNEATTIAPQRIVYDAPTYPFGYLYNSANDEARQFYLQHKIENADSFEVTNNSSDDTDDKLLMQCRYCIRHEMGYCSKYTKSFPWKEPLIIKLADGKTFQLRFNCAKCQMEVYAMHN